MISTISTIKDRLRSLDEETICDLLHISSEDLVSKFSDRVFARLEYLAQELEVMYDDGEDGNTDYDSDENY